MSAVCHFLWPVTMTAYTSINTENTVGVSLTISYHGFAIMSTAVAVGGEYN